MNLFAIKVASANFDTYVSGSRLDVFYTNVMTMQFPPDIWAQQTDNIHQVCTCVAAKQEGYHIFYKVKCGVCVRIFVCAYMHASMHVQVCVSDYM